jgi:hypothetical protein
MPSRADWIGFSVSLALAIVMLTAIRLSVQRRDQKFFARFRSVLSGVSLTFVGSHIFLRNWLSRFAEKTGAQFEAVPSLDPGAPLEAHHRLVVWHIADAGDADRLRMVAACYPGKLLILARSRVLTGLADVTCRSNVRSLAYPFPIARLYDQIYEWLSESVAA